MVSILNTVAKLIGVKIPNLSFLLTFFTRYASELSTLVTIISLVIENLDIKPEVRNRIDVALNSLRAASGSVVNSIPKVEKAITDVTAVTVSPEQIKEALASLPTAVIDAIIEAKLKERGL